MYSEPLMKALEGNKKLSSSTGEAVNFEEEITYIKDILAFLDCQIKMVVNIATLQNLEKVIQLQPTIIHIICHGDFDVKQQKFFICFELNNGYLDKCSAEDLEKVLSRVATKLVFVNACHSEAVGRVFLKAGVPFVVAVQSRLKIQNEAAQEFAKTFYLNVFSGKTIRESFEVAQQNTQLIRGNDVFTCCCAHSHSA